MATEVIATICEVHAYLAKQQNMLGTIAFAAVMAGQCRALAKTIANAPTTTDDTTELLTKLTEGPWNESQRELLGTAVDKLVTRSSAAADVGGSAADVRKCQSCPNIENYLTDNWWSDILDVKTPRMERYHRRARILFKMLMPCPDPRTKLRLISMMSVADHGLRDAPSAKIALDDLSRMIQRLRPVNDHTTTHVINFTTEPTDMDDLINGYVDTVYADAPPSSNPPVTTEELDGMMHGKGLRSTSKRVRPMSHALSSNANTLQLVGYNGGGVGGGGMAGAANPSMMMQGNPDMMMRGIIQQASQAVAQAVMQAMSGNNGPQGFQIFGGANNASGSRGADNFDGAGGNVQGRDNALSNWQRKRSHTTQDFFDRRDSLRNKVNADTTRADDGTVGALDGDEHASRDSLFDEVPGAEGDTATGDHGEDTSADGGLPTLEQTMLAATAPKGKAVPKKATPKAAPPAKVATPAKCGVMKRPSAKGDAPPPKAANPSLYVGPSLKPSLAHLLCKSRLEATCTIGAYCTAGSTAAKKIAAAKKASPSVVASYGSEGWRLTREYWLKHR